MAGSYRYDKQESEREPGKPSDRHRLFESECQGQESLFVTEIPEMGRKHGRCDHGEHSEVSPRHWMFVLMRGLTLISLEYCSHSVTDS